MHSDSNHLVINPASELENFQQMASYLIPKTSDIPRVEGIDIFGGTLALSGSIGGDLVIYLDFKQFFDLETRIEGALREGRTTVVENLRRCQRKAGVAMLDVSGHRVTDAFLAAIVHQSFLLGATYELDMFGQITKRLFENLNTRLYQASGEHKFVSLMYGEISDDARFQFLSAAQPSPLVFSRRHDRFMEVGEAAFASSPPLGMVPSRRARDGRPQPSALGFKDDYTVNQWVLMGEGDILLLHTDGLVEHGTDEETYCPKYLEERLRQVKDGTARDIFDAIRADLAAFCAPQDDISLVVIKRG